ncbi:hypothetical protein C8Q78DRAFT_1057025 [Trametes maxima]|nr:hypothetical protein C8Q78DRAFT_1057025 [Trametes maxima]
MGCLVPAVVSDPDPLPTSVRRLGLLPNILNLLVIIFVIVRPGDFFFAVVGIVGAELYANSVLATLNARKLIGGIYVDDFPLYGAEDQHYGVTQQARREDPESIVWHVPRRQQSTWLSGLTSIGVDMRTVTEVREEHSVRARV